LLAEFSEGVEASDECEDRDQASDRSNNALHRAPPCYRLIGTLTESPALVPLRLAASNHFRNRASPARIEGDEYH
jgi:hypothetical protein